MLSVHNGESKGGLALLEEPGIAAARNGRRLKTQHYASSEYSRPGVMLRHAHEPVGGKKFVRTARAGLLQVTDKNIGMKHELPLALCAHQHGRGCGVRLRASSSAAMVLNILNEGLRMHAHH